MTSRLRKKWKMKDGQPKLLSSKECSDDRGINWGSFDFIMSITQPTLRIMKRKRQNKFPIIGLDFAPKQVSLICMIFCVFLDISWVFYGFWGFMLVNMIHIIWNKKIFLGWRSGYFGKYHWRGRTGSKKAEINNESSTMQGPVG